jgi:tRNA C32,U32 (ribose-2'-O)-methylase TrmJ
MQSGKVRSLNLATAAGIVLYEALRQLGSAEAADRVAAFTEEAAAAAGKPARKSRR